MTDVNVKVTQTGAEETQAKIKGLTDALNNQSLKDKEWATIQNNLRKAGEELRKEHELRSKALQDLKDHTNSVVLKVQEQMRQEERLKGIRGDLTRINERLAESQNLWVKGLLAAGVAYGTFKVGQYIQEATMLHGKYEELGIVMRVVGNNAGYTGAEMEEAAKKVQSMGITMLESRNTVIKLAQAQIDLADAHKLARAAQDVAVLGQINSSQALERMIYAIQSGSVLMLRHLGINVSFENTYKELARTLGITTGALTENQKMIARKNVVLEQAAKLVGTYEASMTSATKQIRSMERFTEDAKVMIGATFNDALVIAVEAFTERLKNTNKELQDLTIKGTLEEWGRGIINVLASVGNAFVAIFNLIRIAGRGVATAVAFVQGPGAVGLNVRISEVGAEQAAKNWKTWQEMLAGGPAGQTETDALLNQMNALTRAAEARFKAKEEQNRWGGVNLRPEDSRWTPKQNQELLAEIELGTVNTNRMANQELEREKERQRKAEEEKRKAKKTTLEQQLKEQEKYYENLYRLGELSQEDYLSMLEYTASNERLSTEKRAGFQRKYQDEKKKIEEEILKNDLDYVKQVDDAYYENYETAHRTARDWAKERKKLAQETLDNEIDVEKKKFDQMGWYSAREKAEMMRNLADRLEMIENYQGDRSDIEQRANALRKQATEVEERDTIQFWNKIHGALEDYLGQIGRWAFGLKSSITSIGEAIKGLFQSIAGSIIDQLAKIGANWIFQALFGGGVPGAGGAGGFFGNLFGEDSSWGVNKSGGMNLGGLAGNAAGGAASGAMGSMFGGFSGSGGSLLGSGLRYVSDAMGYTTSASAAHATGMADINAALAAETGVGVFDPSAITGAASGAGKTSWIAEIIQSVTGKVTDATSLLTKMFGAEAGAAATAAFGASLGTTSAAALADISLGGLGGTAGAEALAAGAAGEAAGAAGAAASSVLGPVGLMVAAFMLGSSLFMGGGSSKPQQMGLMPGGGIGISDYFQGAPVGELNALNTALFRSGPDPETGIYDTEKYNALATGLRGITEFDPVKNVAALLNIADSARIAPFPVAAWSRFEHMMHDVYGFVGPEKPSPAPAGRVDDTYADIQGFSTLYGDDGVRYKMLRDGNGDMQYVPYATGTDMLVTKPTLFLAGEVGSERVQVSPTGAAHGRGRGGDIIINVQGTSLMDNFSARRMALELKRTVNA